MNGGMQKAKRQNKSDINLSSFGIILDPAQMGAAASIASNVFEKQGLTETIPREWHERAARAWEFYLEEPIVSNTINSWRVTILDPFGSAGLTATVTRFYAISTQTARSSPNTTWTFRRSSLPSRSPRCRSS